LSPAPPISSSPPPSSLDDPPDERTRKRFIACAVAAFVFMNVLLAIYAVRTHGSAGIRGEGLYTVTEIAGGIARCGTRDGKLPPTSRPVPLALDSIRGTTFRSTASDWQDEAFTCSGFHLDWAQHFQYRWECTDAKKSGVVSAEADLDGDGSVDQTITMKVVCANETGNPNTPPGFSCHVEAAR
jgi:hypothetical protein